MTLRGCYARNLKRYMVTRSFVVKDTVMVNAANTEIAKDMAMELPRPDFLLYASVTMNHLGWRAKRLPR